jgi:hypothetical protein
MKKIYLLLSLFGTASIAFAQIPVSQTSQKRNILIEEFTGVNCGFCPDGHKIVRLMEEADPTHVFPITIHSGGFATPQSGQLDFRTTFGNTADAMAYYKTPGPISYSYPAAMFNRHQFSSLSILAVQQRALFPNFKDSILALPNAYANVGVSATVDTLTRKMTVHCQVYYTGNSTVASNRLHIALLQSEIIGNQHNYGSSTHPYNEEMYIDIPTLTYRHQRALRSYLTGANGILINGTLTASGMLKIDTTFTYDVPASIAYLTSPALPVNLSHLHLVAYLSQGSKEIINVSGTDVELSATGISEKNKLESTITVFPNPSSDYITINTAYKNANIQILNVLGETIYNNIEKNEITKVNTSEYAPGIYFVKVTADNKSQTTKFVKSND